MKQVIYYEYKPEPEVDYTWEGAPQHRFKKIIRMYPQPWTKGSMIIFEVIAEGWGRGQDTKIILQRKCFHDHNNPLFALDMGLLYSGVRGFYANNLAYKLFKELFMPTEEYKAEFPDKK